MSRFIKPIMLSFLLFNLALSTGCQKMMEDFMKIDKSKSEQPSLPDNDVGNEKVSARSQLGPGVTAAAGSDYSSVMKTQKYNNRAIGPGVSMTMSVSSQNILPQ